jgi:hypothetical protein
LPPDYEDLAAGRRDSLRPRRRPRGRIGDTRVAGLIAGVANHEARRVYDARVERARKAFESGSEDELAQQLLEAVRLGLWRARSVVDFEAFALHVLGVEPARASELTARAAARADLALERLPDLAVALWIRSEAALLERCPLGAIDVRVADEKILVALSLPLSPSLRVAESVAAIGRSATGLARVLQEEDAPRGGEHGAGSDRDGERDGDRDRDRESDRQQGGGRDRSRWRGPR